MPDEEVRAQCVVRTQFHRLVHVLEQNVALVVGDLLEIGKGNFNFK